MSTAVTVGECNNVSAFLAVKLRKAGAMLAGPMKCPATLVTVVAAVDLQMQLHDGVRAATLRKSNRARVMWEGDCYLEVNTFTDEKDYLVHGLMLILDSDQSVHIYM